MKLSGYYFFMLIIFVEKYPKIKCAISGRPHKLVMGLCEGSFKLLNKITLKLENSH
jgi:hypothetical protein